MPPPPFVQQTIQLELTEDPAAQKATPPFADAEGVAHKTLKFERAFDGRLAPSDATPGDQSRKP